MRRKVLRKVHGRKDIDMAWPRARQNIDVPWIEEEINEEADEIGQIHGHICSVEKVKF